MQAYSKGQRSVVWILFSDGEKYYNLQNNDISTWWKLYDTEESLKGGRMYVDDVRSGLISTVMISISQTTVKLRLKEH
jgi:hypothetical protein